MNKKLRNLKLKNRGRGLAGSPSLLERREEGSQEKQGASLIISQ